MESTVMISSLLCNILIGCFCLMIISLTISGIQTIVNEHKREKREEKKALQYDEYHAKRMEALNREWWPCRCHSLLTKEVKDMEQIINMSNQLIAVIVNVIFFLVIYGTIFYILGVIIIGIAKTVYDKFSPIWKKWYQDMKRKKR